MHNLMSFLWRHHSRVSSGRLKTGTIYRSFLLLLCLIHSAVSNQPPRFVSFQSALFISEGTAVGEVLGVLSASDSDDQSVNFVIRGDIANSILELVPVTSMSAEIRLKTTLDRETVDQYSILFEVSDAFNTISKYATLYVTDVNDNAPAFVNLPYRAEVPEDAAVGLSVFQVSASDPDLGISGLISYNITTTQGLFTVDTATGIVTLADQLDYETEKFYQLEIMAVDGGLISLNSTTDLIITVGDIQDTAPFFLNSPYLANIPEDLEVGQSVLSVSAKDGDQGVPNPIRYSFLSGLSQYFNIDENTGLITLAQVIDREDASIRDLFGALDIVVQAEEVTATPQGPTQATAQITISIVDINDQTPTFSQASYNGVILENTQLQIPVRIQPDGTEIIVTDYDQGDKGRFELFLEKDGAPFDVFEIIPEKVLNEATVLLRVKDPLALDYETITSLTFEIVAREYLTPEGYSSRASMTVEIEDMNDHWPSFSEETYSASVYENSPINTPVTTITATDEDSGIYGEVSYYIRGASANLFRIKLNTGEVFVNVAADEDLSLLNREQMDTYYLTLEAIDGGGLRSSAQLVILLLDINDNVPSIGRLEYDGYVEENTNTLERPLVIQATDLDLPPNNIISYEIVSGDNMDNFMIDATSGAIMMSSPLDYEALSPDLNGRLELVVMAKDAGTPSLNSTAVVVIYVEDTNDMAPEFPTAIYPAVIPEDTVGGTNVTVVSATDGDSTAPNNEIIYRIESGARDKFRIDGESGVISVENGADLDRDLYGTTYSLMVLAIDRGTPPKTGGTLVNINITDINNKAPVFDPASQLLAIPENTTVGSSILTYVATDADQDSQLTYALIVDAITGEDEDKRPITDLPYLQGLFGIDSDTGTLFVASELDRETVEEVMLVILATDLNGPPLQTATAQLFITLIDVNDNPPTFVPSDTYIARISEASQPGIEIKQVLAIDPDKDPGAISYYLEDNMDWFEITSENRVTGLVTLKNPVDREQNEAIMLTVRAEDAGVPVKTGYATIEVSIEDVNDNSPEWIQFGTTVYVMENATVGTEITTVAAIDADTGAFGSVMYYIAAGALNLFSINSTTGVISLMGPLDREEEDEYTLTIQAQDNNMAPYNDRRITPGYMKITLLDVNDDTPLFDKAVYNADNIQENANQNTQILTVHATDRDLEDNGIIDYFVDPANSNSSGLFNVLPTEGVVYVNQPLRGNVGMFYMTVIARDRGVPSLSNTTKVYITIDDVNDHEPEIISPGSNETVFVYENVALRSPVVQVVAIDLDQNENGEVRYELIENPTNIRQDWKSFNIDPVTGWLTTAEAIDRELQEKYSLEVRAYDLGSPSYDDRTIVTIEVLDKDDNPPIFNPKSVVMNVREEISNIVIGLIQPAYDPDMGNNSRVCYYIVGGDQEFLSYFNLNKTSRALHLVRSIDREVTTSVNLLVKASDDCVTSQWINIMNMQWNESDSSQLSVTILVQDIDDNKPTFDETWFTAGVTRDTQDGEEVVDLSLSVSDIDSAENWNASYEITRITTTPDQLANEIDGQPFQIDRLNGMITTNTYFQPHMQGYFTIDVVVTGGNTQFIADNTDHAEVSIYLLNEEQRAKVILRGTPQEVGAFKNTFAEFLTNITGYKINVDKIQTHVDEFGVPDDHKTDMFIHAVDPKTGTVLDSTVLIDLIDKNYYSLETLFKEYNVINIVPAVIATNAAADEEVIQVVLIIVATFLVILLIIICATFCTCRTKYKRKLKAATAMAFENQGMRMGNGNSGSHLNHLEVPGTNQHTFEGSNPIWLEQYENGWSRNSDTESKNSLDENAIEETTRKSYDEQEMSLDMYNDEIESTPNHRKPVSADLYLQTAIDERGRDHKKVNGNNLNHIDSNGKHKANGDAKVANHVYDNFAYHQNEPVPHLDVMHTTDI